jgi:hypothetical protein
MIKKWVIACGFIILMLTAFAFATPISVGDVGDWVQNSENDITSHFYQKFALTLNTIYWGDFHSHTNYSKDAADCAAENPSGALEFARAEDKADLDFAALNDHAELENMAALPSQDADLWQSSLRISAQYNNEDVSAGKVFIVFPGWEYTNTKGVPNCTGSTGYGHKNVVFKSLTEVSAFRIGACSMPPGRQAVNAQELWNYLFDFRPSPGLEPKAFTLIHTPAHLGPEQGATATNHITDWNVMDSDFTRHAEIISKWGNSEGIQPVSANCPQEDVPIENVDAEILVANTLRNVLYQKWITEGNPLYLLSFIGGTDNHRGHPGSGLEDYCDPGMHYLGGLTGIATPTLTRDNLWSSLSSRHTQASSTGTKIPLLLSVEAAGQNLLMGDFLPFNGGSVRVRALASTNVERIDIIIDGCLIANAAGSQIDNTFDLAPGRHFIYARARLQGQDRIYQAWTSPVYLGDPIHLIGSNSIDSIDVIKITDMSGSLPDVGGAVSVRAWDKDGKQLTEAGSALPLSIINHGTTIIPGADIKDRFPDGAPAAYSFSVESSKMFITNVNNSIDGAVKVPIIYSNGLSSFVSNSIGSRNTIIITDMSGAIAGSGAAITVTAWDASGKAISESTSAETLKLYSHGTTTIAGSSISARFPSGTPMTYEFSIGSPKLIISNVKNSSDGTLNIPTVYPIGVSNFVANSIGLRNSIYISDFSGTLDIGGAAISIRAWDVSGTEIPESKSIGSYKIFNYKTIKITGAELTSRFSSGSPMTYEFTVGSSKVLITNVKSSSDGMINIPTVYTSGITNYTTNYVSDLNTIQITDMSGGIPSGGTSITITARNMDGNMISESVGATALKLNNHGTTTIKGDELRNRFPDGTPVTYEFSIDSLSAVVTNLANSSDGTINIPTVFTIGQCGVI